MRRTLAITAAVTSSLACASMALGGTISGQVFRDYNSNGARNAGGFVAGTSVAAVDVGMAGVTVRAFDNAGTQVGQATTASDGTYRMSVATTGTVRVEFSTPSGYQPSFAGPQAGTSVHFVDAAGATDVNYAVTVPDEYCQDNPDLMTCLQQATGMIGNPSFSARPGSFRVPGAFYGANVFLAGGRVNDVWPANTPPDSAIVAPFSSIGATFGVGVDRSGNAYYGTYVKRHSPYGPAGAVNAVYRVNIATGATSTFVTLGNSTLPAHVQAAPAGWPDYAADGYRADGNVNDVYHRVGRAGLGDVDVTPDGSTLLAVEMTEGAPKLWRVPIEGAGAPAAAGAPVATAIPAPSTFGGVSCVGNWHPMGIGVRGSRVLVGGVCGGTETQWVANPADTSLNSRTNASAFILEYDASSAGFQTIAAFSLGYPKGHNNDAVDTVRDWTNSSTGFWHNWFDGDGGSPPVGGRGPRQQPMLANVEIMDDGDLVLGFRDRGNDQTKSGSIDYESTSGSPSTASNLISGAEVLRLCATGSTGSGAYVRESNGACGTRTGASYSVQMSNATGTPSAASLRPDSPLYYMTYYGPDYGAPNDGHPYTSLGGAASMPGSPYLWITQYDPDEYTSQGLRALGPCPARVGNGNCGPAGAADGAALATVQLSWGTAGWPGSGGAGFGKGNSLGDLELVCDAAPVQIGNRVWIDANRNGIQDAGESPVQGVTVRLYDAAGTVVGTALTDAQGQYYFSSNVTKPAAGDGTSSGGGLVAGQAFTMKFGQPADFAAGGPLDGYVLTKADATATGGASGTAINSKATTSGGDATISVPARRAGFNDHTYDVGFHAAASADVPVAMGDYTWVDTNRDGRQGMAERPLRGVKVALLNAAGTARAKNRSGRIAPIATTNASGRYLISNLAPGVYRARFRIPEKYCFTRPGARGPAANSNPVPGRLHRQIGVTPAFRIYGEARGNTTAFSRKGVTADFANLTIDAGVAPCGLRRSLVTG